MSITQMTLYKLIISHLSLLSFLCIALSHISSSLLLDLFFLFSIDYFFDESTSTDDNTSAEIVVVEGGSPCSQPHHHKVFSYLTDVVVVGCIFLWLETENPIQTTPSCGVLRFDSALCD